MDVCIVLWPCRTANLYSCQRDAMQILSVAFKFFIHATVLKTESFTIQTCTSILSSVGIVTKLRAGFEPRKGQEILIFSITFRPALGPPIQSVPVLFPGGKAAGASSTVIKDE